MADNNNDALEIIDLLTLGIRELAQSWRETSIVDPQGMESTLQASWRALQEKLQQLITIRRHVAASAVRADAVVRDADDLLAVLESIDLSHIPGTQMVALNDATAALMATADKARDAIPQECRILS